MSSVISIVCLLITVVAFQAISREVSAKDVRTINCYECHFGWNATKVFKGSDEDCKEGSQLNKYLQTRKTAKFARRIAEDDSIVCAVKIAAVHHRNGMGLTYSLIRSMETENLPKERPSEPFCYSQGWHESLKDVIEGGYAEYKCDCTTDACNDISFDKLTEMYP